MTAHLNALIRDVPDFPKPGIVFKDITPLLGNHAALKECIDLLALPYGGMGITKVIGIESRGFILAPGVAIAIGAGFVPVRKPGKLPFKSIAEDYRLEYGTATLELHADAARPGDRVLLIDDLIATGGTMGAAKHLLERLGATVVEGAAIVDLPELGGSRRLRESGLGVFTLVEFAGH
jgi:adenine phosphoribosyltransferase